MLMNQQLQRHQNDASALTGVAIAVGVSTSVAAAAMVVHAPIVHAVRAIKEGVALIAVIARGDLQEAGESREQKQQKESRLSSSRHDWVSRNACGAWTQGPVNIIPH